MESDLELQRWVYAQTVASGRPPRSDEAAAARGLSATEVLEAFGRLGVRRLLALAPESGEIVMAPPFSAIPTPFLVRVGEQSYFANCVWDSFGIPAALDSDAEISASCACCGEPMTLEIRDGEPLAGPGLAHFSIPAAQWWDNITFT